MKPFAQISVLVLIALVWPLQANAGKLPWEEYDKLIQTRMTVTAAGPDLFGDQVDLYTDTLSFSVTDISLPGNSSLPVALTRTYAAKNRKGYFSDMPLADWDMDLPSLGGVYAPTWPDQRCSHTAPPPTAFSSSTAYPASQYWNGVHANMPGGGELLVIRQDTPKPSTGGPYYWLTSGFTYFSCLPTIQNGSGEGFLAITADGTRYWFNRMAQYHEPNLDSPISPSGSTGPHPLTRKRNVLYATRVEDRFGNWVTYTYSNAATAPVRLTSIQANDGRHITLTYNANGTLKTASDGTRTWQYAYDTGLLTDVILPDASRWTIDFQGLSSAEIQYDGDQPLSCGSPAAMIGGGGVGTVTHPSGAVGEFEIRPIYSGRSNVPKACANWESPNNNPFNDIAVFPIRTSVLGLVRKRLSGPGLAAREWIYSHSAAATWAAGTGPVCNTIGCADPVCLSDECAGTATTRIDNPDNSWTKHVFGNSYRYNEGKLLRIERGTGASTVLRSEQIAYQLAQSGQPFPTPIGTSLQSRSDGFTAEYLRPQRSRVIAQDGATFSNVVNGNAFDAFARPLSVTKDSSISGNPARTDVTSYHDDLNLWVLGQVESVACTASVPASTTCNGDVVSATDYGWKALPSKTYRFGKLQQTIGYYTSGTPGSISSVTDGNGNKTWLKSWKRGIPQLIQYPATPDQPSGESESAVVNNDGTIASVTDENGYKTCYAYDAMGRISRITYPSETQPGVCDTSAWSATTISFNDGYPAARGLPAGHWRQYIDTGHGRRVVLFDALWRPVIEQAYDKTSSGTINATLSEVAKRYDASGRLDFQSYPSNVAINFTDPNLKGTHTSYDALDRVTKVEQDWEGTGKLTTTTEYLTGFQTRVTNPRGQATLTTLYLAYDQPTYEWPRGINHPEGAYTSIYRNIFGNPWAIARFSAGNAVRQTRWYVYDTHQQLCKTIDDETGATVMHYDGAGNLDWSAAGLGLASTTSCQDTDPSIAARKVARSYDARNRIKSLVFPDHLGDTTYAYTPDNLLAVIEADNGGTSQVTTQYTYNRRRLMTRERMLWNSINWPIDYTYNANGHMSSQRSPVGLVVDYAPNALGQPTKAGSYANSVSYYPNGAIKQFTYGNGIVHTMTQNARQLPERSRDVYGSTVFLDDSYDYDKNGNVAGISDALPGHRGDRTMTYDDLDRLTAATSPMFPGGTLYTYDVLDNLRRVKAPGRDHTYVYDQDWQLTNVTNTSNGDTVIGLDCDLQGNLKNKNGRTFDFDFGNRLRNVKNPNGSLVAGYYVYDGHGRRVRDYTTASKYSQYSRSGQLIFVSDMGARNNWRDHVYLGGSLVAIRERDRATGVYTTKYQHTDALGSPVAVTDQVRTEELERREYEPYGRQLKPVALEDGPGFTGHVLDAATGLNYMQQRYYDPGIGRFLSVDPVTAHEKPGQNFNRYWYANDNPYKFTDPDGRKVVFEAGSTEDFQNETLAQIAELATIPAGEKIVSALIASERTFVLKENTGSSFAQPTDSKSAQNGAGSGGTINHDPSWTPTVDTANGPTPTPSAVVLGHELSHAVDYDQGTLDRSVNPDTGARRSEEKATGIENKIRVEMGLPERSHY